MTQATFSESDYRDQSDFRTALRTFLRYAEEQSRQLGITPQQHLVLVVTRGHRDYPRVAIGDLARALQLRQSSTSLLVDRCVKRGLLHREEDPRDRRRVMVWLTDEGQTLLDRITLANRKEMGSLEESLFRGSLVDAVQAYRTQTTSRTA
ncbi:MAG: MarR family winged helix-turn-helix transcriptional regulator [Chloroflexota bacterium]